MLYILNDRLIRIEWSIFKGTSQVSEDFSRALVKVFLVGPNEKYLLNATAEGGTLLIDVPEGLPEGAYSIEAIYVKNYGNLLPANGTFTPSTAPGCHRFPLHPGQAPHFIHPHDHRSNDRCLMRSRMDYVFAITSLPSEESGVPSSGEITLRFKSSVASYGYDGLSAYEIAVMRGDFNGSEKDFLQQGYGNITNLPDEEFLTEDDKKITLKDKVYSPNSYSGMGRRILRKNMVNGVNVLIQKMMQYTNTIYVITYDYDLMGEEIKIPENCVLEFDGGSFNNGNIVFNNTFLKGAVKLPLGVTGTITNDEYNVKWFGAKGDGITDDTEVLNWCFNNLLKLYIPTGTYNITNIVIDGDKYGVRWRGDLSYPNKYLVNNGASVLFFHTGSGKMIEFTGNTGYFEIYNICLITGDDTTHGLYFSPTKQSTFFKTIGLNIWANTNNKVATGVALGNGFAITFENFNFSGLNVGIDIPETTDGWFTETVIGSAYPSYIIECNKALNIARARDIIFNNIMIEKIGKVIDMISYAQGFTNVTFNNCYFEDYARDGEFTFNMTDKENTEGCSLLINNCTFLYNTLSKNIFKSNGNLTLQNNRGLPITEYIVSGQFVSIFNEEFYSAYRTYYNNMPNISLFKTDWYNYLGSKNFAITDKFAMGFPNGNINYAQSLRINRRFKVLSSEISGGIVNVPVAYVPVETTFAGMVELKVKMFTKNLAFGYSSSSFGTSHRYQNLTTIKEMNTFTVEPTITRIFDNVNNITIYNLSIPQIVDLTSDVYIECEFYTTDSSLFIQPSWGSEAAIDSTKYIPNGWRFFDINNWKKWNGTEFVDI